MTIDQEINVEKLTARERLRLFRRGLRNAEMDRRLAIFHRAASVPPPNDERYFQQARTLYFFMHKHLNVCLPKPPSDKAERFLSNGGRFRQIERVGTRNVSIGCHSFSLSKNGKPCFTWDELDKFEMTFEMKFKDCFFWCRMLTDSTGDDFTIATCQLGCDSDDAGKISLFEKLCRRYDGIMVMQKMINAQDDYEGVP